MFVPDPGYAITDVDLDQADARIVAWESDCPSLKEIFHDPDRDLHCENADIIFGRHDEPYRQRAKGGVHATNYGATAPVLAAALGITVHDAENFMARYFGERPEVKEWHSKVRTDLQTRRYVENIFGYRRFYFDRIDNLLKEALAWIPQSTVAIAVNIGIKQVERNLKWAEFLLQVHDSAVFQFPIIERPDGQPWIENIHEKFEGIRKIMQVPLPYPDPMTIPVSGKWSLKSWGHCK
jgi:DNA polymerase-1